MGVWHQSPRCRASAFGISALLCVVITSCGGAVGSDERTAADRRVRLQRAVDRFLASRTIPGASVAAIIDGRLVQVTSGVADVATGRKVTAATKFRLASVTKNYIAALALDLAEERVVSLDVPIGRWLPPLPDRLEFVRVATLRQLLSHTSGLGQTYTDDRDRGRVLSTKDLLNRIPRPACDPGKCFSYADGNYVLAGLVLEAASGHDLADELNARLLGPLDLNDTELPDVGASIPTQYALVTDDRGDPVEPHRVREQLLSLSGRNPAGGMIATAGDVARWASQLFGGRVLEPSSLRTLLDTGVSSGLPCPRRCPFPYSLGVYHYNIDGRELIGHDGSSGAVVVYDHERHITVAILTNGGESDTGAFLRQVLRAVAE